MRRSIPSCSTPFVGNCAAQQVPVRQGPEANAAAFPADEGDGGGDGGHGRTALHGVQVALLPGMLVFGVHFLQGTGERRTLDTFVGGTKLSSTTHTTHAYQTHTHAHTLTHIALAGPHTSCPSRQRGFTLNRNRTTRNIPKGPARRQRRRRDKVYSGSTCLKNGDFLRTDCSE